MNYNILKQTVLAVLIGVWAMSASAGEKKQPTLLTYTELSQLPPQVRNQYLKRVSAALIRIEARNPGLAPASAEHRRFSWLDQLIGSAWAESAALRCMYGGFAIRGETCTPKTSADFTLRWRAVEGETVGDDVRAFKCGEDVCYERKATLSCGAGQGLCSPLLYGTGANGSGLCLPTNRIDFTAACREAAFPEGDQEVQDRTTEQMRRVLSGSREQWDEQNQAIEELCSDDFINTSELLKNEESRQDLRATCAVAFPTRDKVNAAIEKYDAQQAATEEPEVTEAESASDPETEGTEEEAEEESGEEVVADEQAEASGTSELCSNLKGTGIETAEARCAACAIQVNETAINQEEYKVSEQWMVLLQAASKVCDRPVDDLVKNFGYCKHRSSWEYDGKTLVLKEIMKEGTNIRDDGVERSAFGPRHLVSQNFRKQYGFGPYYIADLFCGDKENFKTKLQVAHDNKPNMIEPNQVQAFDQFQSCAQEAVGMMETSGKDNKLVYAFNNADEPLSRFETLRCSVVEPVDPEGNPDFTTAQRLMRQTKGAILINERQTKGAEEINDRRFCKVALGDAEGTAKTAVYDGLKGETTIEANRTIFNNKDNKYSNVSCAPTRHSSAEELSAEAQRVTQ